MVWCPQFASRQFNTVTSASAFGGMGFASSSAASAATCKAASSKVDGKHDFHTATSSLPSQIAKTLSAFSFLEPLDYHTTSRLSPIQGGSVLSSRLKCERSDRPDGPLLKSGWGKTYH